MRGEETQEWINVMQKHVFWNMFNKNELFRCAFLIYFSFSELKTVFSEGVWHLR